MTSGKHWQGEVQSVYNLLADRPSAEGRRPFDRVGTSEETS